MDCSLVSCTGKYQTKDEATPHDATCMGVRTGRGEYRTTSGWSSLGIPPPKLLRLFGARVPSNVWHSGEYHSFVQYTIQFQHAPVPPHSSCPVHHREPSTRQTRSMASHPRRNGGGVVASSVRRRERRPPLRAVSRPSCPSAVALLSLIGVLWGGGGVSMVVSAEDLDDEIFTPRSFDGVGNNEVFPAWGAVGTTLVSAVCVRRRCIMRVPRAPCRGRR